MSLSSHVLLVERDRELMAALPAALQRSNPAFRVDTAGDPAEARRRMGQREYHTVLCAVEGPESLSLLAHAKATQPQAAFVLLTEQRNDKFWEKARLGGANFVLRKAPGSEAMAELLSYVLETCDLLRRNRQASAPPDPKPQKPRRPSPRRRPRTRGKGGSEDPAPPKP